MTAALDDVQTVAEMVHRAGRDDFDGWAEQVERCGRCARPVRLRGRVTRRGREVYSTDSEPDGVLFVRCHNRRASVCPSCSYEYAGDMWQLLYAGAAGGRKGVPESVCSHPLVFVTLTAPGFGPVHTTRTDRHGRSGSCRPWGEGRLCPHRRPSWCTALHDEDDSRLGTPLCPDCYDDPRRGQLAVRAAADDIGRSAVVATFVDRHDERKPGDRTDPADDEQGHPARPAIRHRPDGKSEECHKRDRPEDAEQDPRRRVLTVDRSAGVVGHTPMVAPAGALVLRFGRQVDVQTLTFGPVKSARSRRTLALPGRLAELLAEHRDKQAVEREAAASWADDRLVFTTAAGTPVDHRNDAREFKALCERARIPPYRCTTCGTPRPRC